MKPFPPAIDTVEPTREAFFRMGHLIAAVLGRVLTPQERQVTFDFIYDGKGDAEDLARQMKRAALH
jgi:hypothetical protein